MRKQVILGKEMVSTEVKAYGVQVQQAKLKSKLINYILFKLEGKLINYFILFYLNWNNN